MSRIIDNIKSVNSENSQQIEALLSRVRVQNRLRTNTELTQSISKIEAKLEENLGLIITLTDDDVVISNSGIVYGLIGSVDVTRNGETELAGIWVHAKGSLYGLIVTESGKIINQEYLNSAEHFGRLLELDEFADKKLSSLMNRHSNPLRDGFKTYNNIK